MNAHTTTRRRLVATIATVVALLGLQLAVGAGPASAEPSQITFITASPVQTAFGGNWSVQLSTRFAAATSLPIPSDQATVDVYLSGITEPYATRLPIQPDGSVYVSGSSTTPLAPGEYQMTAQLVPVTGGFIEGSTTTSPLTLQVTAYSVVAKVTVDNASVAAGEPVIEAALSGQFVETTGAVPAGTWAFTVASQGTTVLETEVAQDAGENDALRYAITEKLDTGKDYDVTAKFTPVDALAAGLEVTQPDKVSFHTPDGSITDPIPYPLWALILTALVPLLLAAAAIVFTVLAGRRRAALAAGPAAAGTELPMTPVGGQPIAEPVWDPFATAHAEPAAPTQVLPPQQDVAPEPYVAPQDAPTQVLPPLAPGEPTFTELLQAPVQPAQPVQPVQPPVQPPVQEPPVAPAGWSLSQDAEDVDTGEQPPPTQRLP